VLPLEGERKPLLLLGSSHNERWPVLSADGRWLAYLSDESGRPEVYVQAFPRPGGKWQVSTDGGGEPVWARNGRELFYRNGYRLMVVPVQTGPVFTPGKAQVLFEWPYEAMDGIRPNYDVTPDVAPPDDQGHQAAHAGANQSGSELVGRIEAARRRTKEVTRGKHAEATAGSTGGVCGVGSGADDGDSRRARD
jgi:hypothetical protein